MLSNSLFQSDEIVTDTNIADSAYIDVKFCPTIICRGKIG